MSNNIPEPLTLQDEEAQLELAIQQSLAELSHSVESNASSTYLDNTDKSRPESSNSDVTNDGGDTSSKVQQSPPVPIPIATNTSRNSYNRSVSDFSAYNRGFSLNRQLSLDDRYTSSNSWSPPRPTFTTDCCEVKQAIIMKNDEYLRELKQSFSRATSPLHAAIRRDHIVCLENIISEIPMCINKRSQSGETPLYIAVNHKNHLAARRLIQAGAEPNIARINRDTPLQAAVESGNLEMVEILLKGGADPNHALNRGWTSLHESVYQGNTDVLHCLLNHNGNPNVRDEFGISPVFTSAACGRSDCLEILLNSGGDPNLSASTKSAPPLYEACKESHVDCVKTLIAYKADPHIPNCDGLLPIHIASYKGCEEIVEQLLKITQRSIVEKCGMSPLHSAAKGDQIEVLEMLIESGYDVNKKLAKDKITYRDRRQTALFFAVHNDSEEAAEILLKAGAKTELDYVKPLLVAVTHSQYSMVDLLLEYGADINATFSAEGTNFPTAIAFALKDYRMLQKLLLSGCEVEKCYRCPMGSRDHNTFDENTQKSSFCHFLSQEQNSPWAGWVTRHLLEYAGNVNLCSRMVEVLSETEEWEDIQEILQEPRELSHLCRIAIRRTISHDLTSSQCLPLPELVRNFIDHDFHEM